MVEIISSHDYSLASAAACHHKFDPNREEGPAEAVDIQSETDEDDMDVMAFQPVQRSCIAVSGPISHYTFTYASVQPPVDAAEYQ